MAQTSPKQETCPKCNSNMQVNKSAGYSLYICPNCNYIFAKGEKLSGFKLTLEKLKGIINKLRPEKETEEKLAELELTMDVYIKFTNLTSSSDVDDALNLLSEGNIIFLKIGGMKHKNLAECKKCISQLKKECTSRNWGIIGIGEDYLLLTPEFVKIEK